MKNKYYNKFYQYYLIILLMFFIICNLLLESLIINGHIYNILMLLLILVNSWIVINYNEKIKYQQGLYLLFIISPNFSKNFFFTMLMLTTIILLTILNFLKSILIKVVFILVGIVIILNLPLAFIIILVPVLNHNEIYEDTHYYCDNTYEIYFYSAGAMDKFHYKVTKNIKILDIKDALEIVYTKDIGNTLKEYNSILKNSNCKKVGES